MGNFDVKINIPVTNNALTEVLIAFLSDYGFEGFIEEEKQLRAFIPDSAITETELNDYLNSLPVQEKLTYEISKLEEKNWNEEWEKNFFQPIRIGDKCLIRSSFHPVQSKTEYEILVDPKMSFGTGHHATTYLMIEELLETELQNKTVLDMGCGTGILAILAAMRGSKNITAIDIDEWAYNNTLENIAINKVHGIEVELGGAEKLGQKQFDVIIANINRNILVEDMKYYAPVLKAGGNILFSGFYFSDLSIIKVAAENNNLTYHHHKTRSDWTMAVFTKALPDA
ncbi:50S ribosomal protein L11 methyltransferase [Saccharicrinis sp. FJH54]|uniref:50S ribosomal protein L11 methyltransferase n=1 Tax=Saccharicrinis sp. FJH54 TaxID=3344665 RepID=UPI0035D3E0D7